jgi:ribosomal protein L37AE/L43A
VANPSPAKVSAECPHCGFKQMEYAAAKSSICRQCGRSFTPFAPKPGLKLRTTEEAPALSSVSNVNENNRFLAQRRRQSARPAARTLICAITKSPADLVEAFAPAVMCIFPAKAILPAVAWSANPL